MLPLQYSKCLQYRAHEAADEAALSQSAAHLCSVRCVFKTLSYEFGPLPSISCCALSPIGENPTCRRRYWDHRHRGNGPFLKDAEKDVTKGKPQRQSKRNSSSSTANSNVILPKIVNRWQIKCQMVSLFSRLYGPYSKLLLHKISRWLWMSKDLCTVTFTQTCTHYKH